MTSLEYYMALFIGQNGITTGQKFTVKISKQHLLSRDEKHKRIKAVKQPVAYFSTKCDSC